MTKFAPHYQGDDIAGPGEWLSIRPLYVRNPALFDITGMLDHALHNYPHVPEIREDGEIL